MKPCKYLILYYVRGRPLYQFYWKIPRNHILLYTLHINNFFKSLKGFLLNNPDLTGTVIFHGWKVGRGGGKIFENVALSLPPLPLPSPLSPHNKQQAHRSVQLCTEHHQTGPCWLSEHSRKCAPYDRARQRYQRDIITYISLLNARNQTGPELNYFWLGSAICRY